MFSIEKNSTISISIGRSSLEVLSQFSVPALHHTAADTVRFPPNNNNNNDKNEEFLFSKAFFSPQTGPISMIIAR